MTTNKAWLGLVGAALVFAACDSSKDSLLTTSGKGGSSNAGAGGGAGGAGGSASGGAGGARACAAWQCARPYECITTCGGPIISNNCCMCEAPAFDNFLNMACGGSGGAGAAGAAGSSPGGSGGAGASGSAGRGGGGGGAAGAAGGPGGRGGTSGAAGSASGGTAGGVDGGSDARLCDQVQCARPYVCKRACGAAAEYTGCCMCEAPLFDDFNGMACGDGGTGAISYVGCRYIGGYDRIVVAKRDTSRDLCVNVVLINGPADASAGLTAPPGFTLDSATVGPASACPTMARLATAGGPVTGSVVSTSTPGSVASTVDVDIHVTLPGNDEAIITRNLDVARGCL
jgi:hypothetical protein